MMPIILNSPVASIDIDAQNGFTPHCPDELPVPLGQEIVPELNRQAQFAQYRLGSKDAHSPQAVWVATPDFPPLSKIEGENVDLRWPVHCVPGTPGFALLAGLPSPSQYDYFVWKGVEPDMHPYGACYHDLQEKLSTGVIEFLQCKGVKTVIVGGLATEYCVKNTVLQLLQASFDVIVNLAACRGLDPLSSIAAMEEMHQRGATLIESSDYLNVSINIV